MDSSLLSALSALGGSLIGGLTSGLTTWVSQRSQARNGQRAYHLAQRMDLYRDFIATASEMYGQAVISDEPKTQDLVVLYGMISRMRVLSSPAVVDCAEKTLGTIVEAYFAPNMTVRQMRELVKNKVAVDPLREFSEVTREELRAI